MDAWDRSQHGDALSELLLLDWVQGPPSPMRGFGERTSTARMPIVRRSPASSTASTSTWAQCIGCKCCVVACNEQNGNPASINWRRVGEIEGGWYPATSRSYLSMGCNHCLEPTCLRAVRLTPTPKTRSPASCCTAPTRASAASTAPGTVRTASRSTTPSAAWSGSATCATAGSRSARRRRASAPVRRGRIAIEIVNVAEWRASVETNAAAIGMPVADGSLSTTRISLPEDLPPNARPRDITHVTPEHAHWSLIVMTVLTQLSVGAFATIWLLQLLGVQTRLGLAALVSLGVGGLALAAATFHLGRPAHAYRALRMWRRSWLSREVVAFAAFSHVAAVYAGLLWLQLPGSVWVGGLTTMLGLAGVTASACIYRVPARPAWNTPYTLLQFNLTAAILGPLFAAAAVAGATRWLAIAAASMAVAQATVFALRFFRAVASDSLELKGTARLLSTVLANRLLLRGVLLATGAIALPLFATGLADGPGRMLMLAALLVALAAELVERYLFFVSVVPKHLAAPYIASASEAA